MKITFLLFFILLAFTGISFACPLTELGVPACAYFTRADAVFLGKALKVEDAPKSEDLPEGSRKVRFQVLQNFKGADNPTFTLVTNAAKADGGLSIKSGQTWVVYANNDIVVKSFSVSRGVKIEPKMANEELETLKNVAAGKTETSISGRIASDKMSGKYLYETVEISIEGSGNRQTVKTDSEGAYNFVVSPGVKYKVELKFPYNAGLVWADNLLGTSLTQGNPTLFKYEVELYQGDCNYNFFEVTKKNE